MAEKYYSNGKLLLTGEYAILDGAVGLAVPTKFGQHFEVLNSQYGELIWQSYDADEELWFEAVYSLPGLSIVKSTDEQVAETLLKILVAAKQLDDKFLSRPSGLTVISRLTFPRKWGLGTSSTLINNIAQWAKIDAFVLLGRTLGGSGYDIACAQHFQPLLFHLDLGKPKISVVAFDPPFKDRLYFIYLNQKQDSREAIANYRRQTFNKKNLIAELNSITQKMLEAQSIEAFESLIIEHEQLLSQVLNKPPIKRRFPNYFGAIKSLGAWGGDFILATGNKKTPDYFKAKGFETVIPFEDMVL